MNTLRIKKNLKLRSLTLTVILSIGMFLVGCETSNDDMAPKSSDVVPAYANNLERSLPPGELSITEIATSNENFEELVRALIHVDSNLGTDLVDMFLTGLDQYTVFAPTDDAFFRLYNILQVDEIEQVDPETVLNVLLYHVAEGRRASNSVVPKKNIRTIATLLEDSSFMVDETGKIWAVGNQAMIVTADISASNGIIHVIDEVLLPF